MSTSNVNIYNEDVDINIPNILNGVAQLGDLWDCQTSRALNMKLFKELDECHVKVSSSQNTKYTLDHISTAEDKLRCLNVDGELALEFLIGLIKVASSADFDDVDEVKGRKFEKLTCHYYVEKFNMEVLPKAKEILNDQVVDQLINRQIKATHVVQRIVLGAEIDVGIKIECLNPNKVTDFKSI
jgi:hypothetical protein